jgi:hypothetical protein
VQIISNPNSLLSSLARRPPPFLASCAAVRCQAQAASHPHGSAACQPSATGRDAARPSPSSPAHRSRSPFLSMAPAPQSHLARICGRRQAGHPRRAATPRAPSPSSRPLLPIPCLLHDTSTAIPSFSGAPSHDDEASSAAGHHSAPLHPPGSPHRFTAGRPVAGDGLLASPPPPPPAPPSSPPWTRRRRAPSQLLICCW